MTLRDNQQLDPGLRASINAAIIPSPRRRTVILIVAASPSRSSRYTSHAFTSVLLEAGIAVSMDGKGSWRDNVFVERLWRSIKYEEVYLKAYNTVSEARASIGRYLTFYNGRRPHSSLDRQTPDQAYFNRLPLSVAA